MFGISTRILIPICQKKSHRIPIGGCMREHYYMIFYPCWFQNLVKEMNGWWIRPYALFVCVLVWIGVEFSSNSTPNPPQALFGCCRIHLNPHVLEWIGVEFSSSSTPIHTNTCGLMWIRLHPNKVSTHVDWCESDYIQTKPCLDVVRFASIHMYWSGLGWNLVQVPLQPTPTHVDWCETDYCTSKQGLKEIFFPLSLKLKLGLHLDTGTHI